MCMCLCLLFVVVVVVVVAVIILEQKVTPKGNTQFSPETKQTFASTKDAFWIVLWSSSPRKKNDLLVFLVIVKHV